MLLSHPTGRTYVGITVDLERRLAQHNGLRPGGARSTRAHRPWTVGVVYGPFGDRAVATRVERQVKRARGHRRLSLADLPQPPPGFHQRQSPA